MKKLLNFLLLFPLLTIAQINIDNNWKNLINPTFQNLDKTKIQSKILLDYAMEFTDVTAYNGVLTDTTYIDANVMGNIYKTLFMSKVVADTLNTPLFDRYAYNWAKARFKATKDSSSVYILSGLLYEYQKFNVNALAQNKITVSANKYYDKYITGVWQNPYETLKTFALTTPIQQSSSKRVYFKLPNTLLLSNIKSQIANIQINADNGLGYVNFPLDATLQMQFFENKIHNITYRITLTNNQVLYCRSKFKIDDPTLNLAFQRGSIVVNDQRVYIYENGNFFNAAWLTIRRIPGNTTITRPFIIAEGLDTGNFTAPEDFGGERTFDNFVFDVRNTNTAGNLATLLDDNQQYDLIYVDWVRGMADMRTNSRVLEEVIKWVNDQKVLSGSTQPNVLLGQSMGGVIGRYTLARMEKEFKPHNVRLFIAHDSPMQGANTPLAFQHFAIHMRQEYTSTPLAYAFGEVLIPVGFGLAELGSSFLNIFGANTSVPTYVTPAQLLSLQDKTASRQLNYWSAIEAPFGNQTQTRSFNESWQQTLTAMGWPLLSRNVAISNGNECSANNGFAPGAALLVINSRSNPGFWLDALNAVLAPLVGAVTQDLGLIIVGALPGRSRWQTNFDFNTYGAQGAQNQIYLGRIRFEKKLLWIGPTIIHNLINRSFNAPLEALPFDTYSGGRFNFFDSKGDFVVDIPILSNLVNVVNAFYGFIPVVSALDIKRNNGQVNPTDYLKKYAGGTTPELALTSGFKNFIVDYNNGNPINNEHISFQARNGNWLAQEMQVNPSNPIYPNYNCSYICNPAIIISGPDKMCTNGSNYSVSLPNSLLPTWSVISGSTLVTMTNNSNSSITLTSNNYSGTVVISATFGDATCGYKTITKTVSIGNNIANFKLTLINSYCDSSFRYYVLQPQNIPNQINGFSNFIPSSGIFTTPFNGTNNVIFRTASNYTGTASFNILATNNGCGKFTYPFSIGSIKDCQSTQPARISATTSIKNYIVYPNPSNDIINIELLDQNAQPQKETVIIGELFDVFGQSKNKIEIIDNKAIMDVKSLPKGIYILKISIDGLEENHEVAVN